MRSIADAVEKTVNQSPFLRELLTLDIVNISGLARKIKDTVEEQTQKKVTQGSLVMALKRMTQNNKQVKRINAEVFDTTPELVMRSNLFEITAKNSATLIEAQRKLVDFANQQQSRFVIFSHSLFETTTIMSNQLREKVKELYVREKVILEIEDVAIITIKFPTDIVNLPFVYYTIFRTLAWAGISITEIVSTYSELIIVLQQDDTELAFSLIKKLFSNKRKNMVMHP